MTTLPYLRSSDPADRWRAPRSAPETALPDPADRQIQTLWGAPRPVDATMRPVKGRVLVVDDDTALAEMLGIVLRSEGFEPLFCGDGAVALDAFRDTRPDLVLLDLMLPGRDGIDVCRAIRAESGVPIVMLTAKTDTVDIVLGLESGADDYVVKPFKPKELVARLRARLRINAEESPEQLTIGDLEIDVAGHSVRRESETLSLTPLESPRVDDPGGLTSRGRTARLAAAVACHIGLARRQTTVVVDRSHRRSRRGPAHSRSC